MKKRSFISDLILISSISVLLNIISLIFRFYLAKLISPEGIGVYQLILSVYMFAATVATSGLSFTTTRFVSEAIATKKENSVRSILSGVFIFASVPAFAATAAMWFLSDISAVYFIGIPDTSVCLKILAAALPFMAAASCINGFFVAVRKAAYSSAIQIFEDLFQIAVTVSLLIALKPESVIEACVYVVIGCVASEVSAAAVSFILLKKTDIIKNGSRSFSGSIVTAIAKTTIPLSISSYIKSILSTVENLMIPVSLQKSGMSRQKALSAVGTVKGLAVPVICFPSVFIGAFAKLLLPEISDLRALKNNQKITESSNAVLSFTLTISVLFSAVFFLFSDDIGLLIFNDKEFFITLKLLSPLIPFMYIDCISDSILKGLDQQVTVMKYSIAEAFIRTCAVWFLIPQIGFSGVIITMYAGNVTNSVLGIRKLKKMKITTLPFLSRTAKAVCLYMIILIPISLAIVKFPINFILKIIMIGTGTVICFLSAFIFNLITKNELKSMKKLIK